MAPLQPLLGALLLHAAPAAGWFFGGGAPTKALQLTQLTFDGHLKDNPNTLVEFYAPKCPHCDVLAPKFDEATKLLHAKGVSGVKVDVTQNKDLAEKYEIKSWPQVLLFVKGEKELLYNGERSTKAIVQWASFRVRPAVEVVAEVPEIYHVPNVVCRGPELLEAYVSTARMFRLKASWYFVEDKSLAKPVITMQHRDEESIVCEGDTTDDDTIEEFFEANQVPLLGVLTGESWEGYNKKPLVWVLAPMGKEDGSLRAAEEKLRPLATPVAKQFRQYSFTIMDTNQFRSNIDSMLGVKQFPALVVQPEAGGKVKYVYQGELTTEAMTEFLSDVVAGKVEPQWKSEPVPVRNDGAVRVLVGQTFAEEVFQEDRDVMVEVYAPWCGACKAFEPEYRKLAKYVKQWELTGEVTIAKLDGTTNDMREEAFAYTGFPTVYFVPAGSKTPKLVEARDAKGIWKWVKENTGRAEQIKAIQDRVKEVKKTEIKQKTKATDEL